MIKLPAVPKGMAHTGVKKLRKIIIEAVMIALIMTSCSFSGDQGQSPKDIDDFQGSEASGQSEAVSRMETTDKEVLVNPDGAVIKERFYTPEGFERVASEEGSFEAYLQDLPLKPHGTKVKYYNGKIKPRNVYEAVIDIDVGERDLQQCADAVMRLRGEYLYGKGMYDKIKFHFTNGFLADYSTWMQGNRISVNGNDVSWVKRTGYSTEYSIFRQYMDMVFAYASTVSLASEMKNVPVEEMKIGDVFLKGDLPGHCVIIVDMAENKSTGEKLFMVAQSYMPAQDIHILKNPEDPKLSPWYRADFGERLKTPEWEFTKNQLMRFED